MGTDTTDLAEMRTLSTTHPSEAPRLVGGGFVSGWFTMDSEWAGLSRRGTYVGSQARPYVEGESGGGVIAGYRLAATERLLWVAVGGRPAPHRAMRGVTQ